MVSGLVEQTTTKPLIKSKDALFLLEQEMYSFNDYAEFIENSVPNPRFSKDQNLFVRFSIELVIDEERTKLEGRPIYNEEEFISITIPGDKNTLIKARVDEEYKYRFRERYNSWKANHSSEQSVSGTPLSMWPRITKSQVEELRYFSVSTVEQLAEMPDSTGSRFMGFQSLKQAAQTFLEAAKGEAVYTKLESELEKRDAQIALLQSQIDSLSSKKAA